MNAEDRKKFIGLIAAIVSVFGLAAWRVNSVNEPAVAVVPIPDVTAQATDTSDSSAVTGNAGMSKPDERDIKINDEFMPVSIDPFQSVVSKSGAPQVVTASTVNQGKVKDSTVPPMPSAKAAMPPVITENVELSGVVGGREPLAIVLIGTESFVVGIGQKFGSGFIVASIGRDTIQLKHGKKVVHLSIGQQAQHIAGLQNRIDSTSNQTVSEEFDDDLLMVMATSSEGEYSDEMAEIDPPTLFSQSNVDPFREVLPKTKKVVAPKSPAHGKPPMSVRNSRNRPRLERNEVLPAVPGDFVPMPGTLSGALPDPAIETVRSPEMSVSGIISGQNAVAIVHVGNRTFVIGKGETFSDGYQIVEIGRDYVRIQRGKEVIRLTVTEMPENSPDPPDNRPITKVD